MSKPSQAPLSHATNSPRISPAAAPSATDAPMAPAIATRKSCNPDGIGLSHYVLMDRKVAK